MANYTLKKQLKNEREHFVVCITGDYGDGDYNTTTQSFSKEQFDGYISDSIQHLLLHASEGDNLRYYRSEHLRLPHGYDDQAHTLVSAKVEFHDKDGVVWDVDIEPGIDEDDEEQED